ncbi:MAG: MMPL family transporter, partial [Planctomycetota bacterium]
RGLVITGGHRGRYRLDRGRTCMPVGTTPAQIVIASAAAGVVVSVLMMFLLLPALLVLLPSRNGSVAGGANKRGKSISQRLAASVIRWHAPVTVVCVIIMLAFAFRIPSIESTVRLQDRFLPSSDAIADYRWLEDRIGPMVPLEIVIRFAESDPRDRADQIRIVRSVQAAIQASEPAVATFSAANISPSLPKGRSVREIVKRQMIDGAPFGNALADAGMMRLLDGDTLWRISVRAPAVSALDYGELSESIRQAVKPKLESYDVEGVFTGVIPLIYKAQRQLLVDLFRSFVLAFAIIAVVLLFVLRSVPATFAAMIPNLFPAIVIFGGIELIGVPVQIGSVMTASAALGIAVDDTVHFLTWFRRGVREGHSRDDSIRSAFDHCAGAMLLTTLICAGGLSVFALSSFVPILHFAYLMVLLLAAALIGDLVLLPAILAGPLGRLFESKRKRAAGFVASSTTNRVT